MLRMGFGDVMGDAIALDELAARAERVASQAETMPLTRNHGPLRLDLKRRDAAVDGQWLRLHPREFGLLWRLAETPGAAVSSAQLLAQVWQLNFRPETNSLAVHVCRLRGKLGWVGLAGMVRTTDDGSYMLANSEGPAIPLASAGPMFDAYIRTRENTYDRLAEPQQ